MKRAGRFSGRFWSKSGMPLPGCCEEASRLPTGRGWLGLSFLNWTAWLALRFHMVSDEILLQALGVRLAGGACVALDACLRAVLPTFEALRVVERAVATGSNVKQIRGVFGAGREYLELARCVACARLVVRDESHRQGGPGYDRMLCRA